MSDITLSICIPTYNRARLLDHLLSHFETWNLTFSYEIVISDNASTDDTFEVVEKHRSAGLPIRYFRQEFNKGAGPNGLNMFRRGRGAYFLYLADDDLLIPDALTKAITYLTENPEIRALYAPWELYDEVNSISAGKFYTIEHDVVFKPDESIELLRLMIRHHIFPEIVIYRADAMRGLTMETRFCFWAFTYLSHVAAQGPVAFVNTPYYRSVTLTPVVPDRIQAGSEQAMIDWDVYRGGLEYFIHLMLRRCDVKLNATNKQALRDAVDSFIGLRMRVALRLWLARGDYARAYELICRLSFLDPSSARALGDFDRLPLLLLAQILARFANALSGIKTLMVKGVDDLNFVAKLLGEVGLEQRIAVELPADATTEDERNATLVFLSKEEDRQAMLDQGYAPGLIISEAELTSGIHFG